MVAKAGGTSRFVDHLFSETDIKRYDSILAPYQDLLTKNYPNSSLTMFFTGIGRRLISVGPMSLCEGLLLDIGKQVQDEALAGLALHMLAISLYDDIVDELPNSRTYTSSLLYAGSIAANTGTTLIIKYTNSQALDTLLRLINKNHYYQQHVIETLWTHRPASFQEYTQGVRHAQIFAAIGLVYALGIANRLDLEDIVMSYANCYGLALQIIDDIYETDEDEKNGYNSYPIIEGFPYKESLECLFNCIESGRKSIPREWCHLQALITKIEHCATEIHKNITAI
jgi:hypothetical protein